MLAEHTAEFSWGIGIKTISRSLLVLLLLTVSFADTLSAQTAKKYALLIGVSKYDHSGMKELHFPEYDAKELGDLLKSGGYEIDVLLGKNAIQQSIRSHLHKISEKGTSDGVVIIGLFGHGVEIGVRNEKGEVILDANQKQVTEGCFCPFDTGVRTVVDPNGQPRSTDDGKPMIEQVPSTLVKLSEVMAFLRSAKAGSRVVFADCCRTIPNQARGRSFGASFQITDLPERTSILFGCSEGEEALESPKSKHGAFTRCLLDELPRLALQGDADTGSLAAQLKKKVPILVNSLSPSNKQGVR